MKEKPRQLKFIGKTFTDKEGKKYEGQRFIQVFDPIMPTNFRTTEIWYNDGKIHGKPAIIYPDGLEEEWENGDFVAVLKLPFEQRSN